MKSGIFTEEKPERRKNLTLSNGNEAWVKELSEHSKFFWIINFRIFLGIGIDMHSQREIKEKIDHQQR